MNSRALLLAVLAFGGSLYAVPRQTVRPPMIQGGAPAVLPDGSQ